MSERAIRVVAGVIERSGRYLITQRRAGAVLPLLWEFPGGRVEAGETDAVWPADNQFTIVIASAARNSHSNQRAGSTQFISFEEM